MTNTNGRLTQVLIILSVIFVFAVSTLCAQDVDTGGGAAATDWLMFRGNPEHTGKTGADGPPEEVELKWRWHVNYDSGSITASPAVSADGIVYIATESGYVAAVDPEGGPGWLQEVDGPVKASPAVDSGGNVFVVTAAGYAYYFSANGELRWKSDLWVDVDTSPVISGGTAYLGTDGKTLLAVNLSPDLSLAGEESKKLSRSDVILWSFGADGTVKSSPAFAGNTVYFGGGNYFYALNPNAGGSMDNGSSTESMVKWKYDISDDIHSSPAVYSGRVYVGADNGYLYAFNENPSDNGTSERMLAWKRKTGGSIYTSPAVDDRDGEVTIYVGSDDGKLYAFNREGEVKWTFPTGKQLDVFGLLGSLRSSPAVDGDGDIYFGTGLGYVVALFPDGSVKWTYPELNYEQISLDPNDPDLPPLSFGPIVSSPAIGAGKLYITMPGFYDLSSGELSNSDAIYCIGESDEEDSGTDPDFLISIDSTRNDLESGGDFTTVSAVITAEKDTGNVLSRIASVKLNLENLNLSGEVQAVDMLDDGEGEDDVADDGKFTFSFQISEEVDSASESGGIYTYPVTDPPVGPVALMVTVADFYGQRQSKPFALNILKKDRTTVGENATGQTTQFSNRLDKQTINIFLETFEAGIIPSILSITPRSGVAGTTERVTIVGKNTNFKQNRTVVVICNNDSDAVAFAPADPNVTVMGDAMLTAEMNIFSTNQAPGVEIAGGPWDVKVITPLADGGCAEIEAGPDNETGSVNYCRQTNVADSCEVAELDDAFTISESAAKIDRAPDAAMHLIDQQAVGALETDCKIRVEIVKESEGVQPDGSPWRLRPGTDRSIVIENADRGVWDLSFALESCGADDLFEVESTVSGSNFGFVVGEVRDRNGNGVDGITVFALSNDLDPREVLRKIVDGEEVLFRDNATTSGNGYYMLPLAATGEQYTIIVYGYPATIGAANVPLLYDYERNVEVGSGGETGVNFALQPFWSCPILDIIGFWPLKSFHAFRDAVLSQSAQGRRWIRLYYAHAPEVSAILYGRPFIRRKFTELVRRASGQLPLLMSGQKADPALERELSELIGLLKAEAGPALRAALRAEEGNIINFLQKFIKN